MNPTVLNFTLMSNLLLAFILFCIGQSLIWVQTNGQFIWPWFKQHPWVISFLFGGVISFILIKATGYIVSYFDGLLWPGRFIGFASGILVFAILTYLIMGESLNSKSIVSLILATVLICIQVFWK